VLLLILRPNALAKRRRPRQPFVPDIRTGVRLSTLLGRTLSHGLPPCKLELAEVAEPQAG
jgi:hypothetical protein